MKTRKYIYLFFIAIFAMACSDEFLDKEPKGTLGKSAESAMGEDVYRLLIAAYSGLDMNVDAGGGWYPRHSATNWILGDSRTDDAHKGSHKTDQRNIIEAETWNVSVTNDIPMGEWRRSFGNIQRANDVISFAKNALDNDPNFTEEDMNRAIAESRFLRGHFYFNLQVFFGNVPYVDENTVDFFVKNDGGVNLWDKIEADFQFGVDNLPENQVDVARADKFAAQAYLAKVHLQQGDFASAKPLLDAVIASNQFSLTEDFEDNFRVETGNNSESIFQVQHTLDEQTNGQNGNMGYAFVGPSAVYSCCGFYQPTIDLVSAYQTDENGLPLIDSYRDSPLNPDLVPTAAEYLEDKKYGAEQFVIRIDPAETAIERVYKTTVAEGDTIIGIDPLDGSNEWELVWEEPSFDFNIDPRLDWTVGRRGVPYMDWGYHPGSNWIREQSTAGPYSPRKYLYSKAERDAGYVRTAGWHRNQSAINYNLIRYAEVLLWAAEAEVEVGSLEKAREYVNMIRERAGNSQHWVKELDESGSATQVPAANYNVGLYETPWTDQAAAREAVRFERRLETAMEGKRWYDLVRWDVAPDVLNTWVDFETPFLSSESYMFGAEFNEGVDEHLPIHQDILDASEVAGVPTLEQNNGY